MSDISLALGDVTFAEFEIPESIGTGGAQTLKIHKLIGGLRVIDAMGRDDKALSWSGTFLGADALARSQALDALRVAGDALTLTFSEFRYQVVVSEYSADIRREYWIPYSITCEVVSDQSNQTTQSSDPTVDDQVMSDTTTVQSLQTSSEVA